MTKEASLQLKLTICGCKHDTCCDGVVLVKRSSKKELNERRDLRKTRRCLKCRSKFKARASGRICCWCSANQRVAKVEGYIAPLDLPMPETEENEAWFDAINELGRDVAASIRETRAECIG